MKYQFQKDRYFGPWDKDLYTSKVKVWIDANRNGIVDDDELKTLEAAVVCIFKAVVRKEMIKRGPTQQVLSANSYNKLNQFF